MADLDDMADGRSKSRGMKGISSTPSEHWIVRASYDLEAERRVLSWAQCY